MKVTYLTVGPIQTNCYLLEDAGELVVVDPGDELDSILSAVGGRPVKEIWATHYHWDHICALAGLEAKTGAPCAMSDLDADRVDGQTRMKMSIGQQDIARGFPAPHVDRRLHEGDKLTVGSRTFEVIETPGHSPGSICFWCPEEKLLLCGDTLFAGGSFGRTDFEDGDFDTLVSSMQGKLSKLPDDAKILPGHGPMSQMAYERARNPYL